MANKITFDKAIELLEITDISKVTIETLPKIKKKARVRWHPDKVSSKNDADLTKEYNAKFQLIDTAIELIRSYLEGNYQAGDAFEHYENYDTSEPEDIIRKNATNMQSTLKNVWEKVKEQKYKWEQKTVNLSDGFKLKDLLKEDFDDDIAMTTVISLIYSTLFAIFMSLIWSIVSIFWPGLGNFMVILVAISWVLTAITHFIIFLPLSRFWLPEKLQNILMKVVETGTGYADWVENNLNWGFLFGISLFIAAVVKYVVLFPIYELAKLFIGNKIVGVVNENVNYYANLAEWYIEELLNKEPNTMTKDELFHLSHLYSELSDYK